MLVPVKHFFLLDRCRQPGHSRPMVEMNRPADSFEADTGRRNMLLLIQLRWIAVVGQLVTIGVVHGLMGIALPLPQLLLAPAALALINLGSQPLVRRRAAISTAELTAALLFDVAALGWQLHYSGGVSNPFAWLFLLHVVLGAMLLTPRAAALIVGAAVLALLLLAFTAPPLALPAPWQTDPMGLYLAGALVCFLLVAVLLLIFIARISRNLRERDAALARIRQQAAEEDHIVRMGLLASGAAHELGTPLASLAVLVGDWKRLPLLAANAELREELDEMETAIQRCKAIVSSILLSAGEARGIAPEATSVRAFLQDIVDELRAARPVGTVEWTDKLGGDVAIVADPALRQVIGNAVDNAAEASPLWIGVTARREGDTLVVEIADRGPGFSADMLEGFGRPYHSSKGRPGGGLGLFLLVNVLRKLGGSATAANRPQGGALVRIALPLAAIALNPQIEA